VQMIAECLIAHLLENGRQTPHLPPLALASRTLLNAKAVQDPNEFAFLTTIPSEDDYKMIIRQLRGNMQPGRDVRARRFSRSLIERHQSTETTVQLAR
jgi:hypothetical protein